MLLTLRLKRGSKIPCWKKENICVSPYFSSFHGFLEPKLFLKYTLKKDFKSAKFLVEEL